MFSRREFLRKAALLSSAAAVSTTGGLVAGAEGKLSPPIVVFSKVFQPLKLNYEQAAEVAAEAGLDGVDAPLRPGGEIEPERAREELPRYIGALRKRKLGMPLLTTAIISPDSPHAEDILHTAKKLGVQYYRVGFMEQEKDVPVDKQLQEAKAKLKDLAALNKEVGIGGLVQNHSPSGHSYLGGDLGQLEMLVRDLNPAHMGIAFDIGHAVIVHGDGWRPHFEKLKFHFRIAYVKDAKREGRWVPFGQGDVAQTGYFTLLRQLGYQAPISLHIEYDWSDKGANKTRAGLIKALRESSTVLRSWLAQA